MLRSSIHIPDKVLQLIGLAWISAFVIAFLSGLRSGFSQAQNEISLATSHPSVPTNVFSAMLDHEDRASLRKYQADKWLRTYGDKVCHSILSLHLCISHGAGLTGAETKAHRALFALYIQAALAETRLQLNDQGVPQAESDGMLDCVALTILDTPLAQLERYTSLLTLGADERRNSVAREAVSRMRASRQVEKHFSAAYALLSTMTMILVSQRS